MYVKICGLRDSASASHAASSGADAVGVVMSAGSPRHASEEQAASVLAAARAARPNIETVLVVREMPATEAAGLAAKLGFDILQLHGRYSVDDAQTARQIHSRIWRAASLADHPTLSAGEFGEERLLVDSAVAGSGKPWDLGLIQRANLGAEWLLAGGLTPASVASAIAEARPAGVDVSSGVETRPGVKSLELISQFIHSARAA